MTLSLQTCLGIAEDAARRAGAYIREHLGSLTAEDIDAKQAADYVTVVDRESESLIIRMIQNTFPDHWFLAEESQRDAATDGYRWIIDPLDGTTNFIHGIPVFAVSISLQHAGKIIVGVVFDPMRDELFAATRGGGAFLNGRKISVSTVGPLADTLIATGFPFKRRDLVDHYLAAFRRILMRVSDLRRPGAASLDLAGVACGRFDGFFEIGLSPWDCAAGGLLIREAGGIITDFGGGNSWLESGNIIAGSASVHALLLEEVKAVFRDVLPR
jgi:myo-inositol-1(or 4)-monophosphatase